MARIEHKLGERFGRLAIISLNTRPCAYDPKKIEWKCRCDCGNELFVRANALHSGKTRSCGCLALEMRKAKKGIPVKYKTTVSETPGRLRAYRSWEKMKSRCLDEKSFKFKDYGGRGILICQRWLESFDNFFEDLGERSEGKTLGRIDNEGNYAPDNCRWEDREQQDNNKRNTLFIKGTPLTQFCTDKNLSASHVRSRLAQGWEEKEALERPIKFRKTKD